MSYFLLDETGRQSGARQAARPKPPRGPIDVQESGRRYYRPDTGRWLNRDPLEDLEVGHGPNSYHFSNNNPPNLVDVDGRSTFSSNSPNSDREPPPLFRLAPPTIDFACFDPDPDVCEACCRRTKRLHAAKIAVYFGAGSLICSRMGLPVGPICFAYVAATTIELELDLLNGFEQCMLGCPCRVPNR